MKFFGFWKLCLGIDVFDRIENGKFDRFPFLFKIFEIPLSHILKAG